MPLTYAGQPLALPTPEALRLVEAKVSLADVCDNALANYDTAGICGVPSAAPPVNDQRVRLGTLTWPSGASRFARFHGLVGKTQLAAIRTAVGTGNSSATFVMSDGNGGSISTPLFMLPPRPLFSVSGIPTAESTLHLLTLVDRRYFWWWKVGSIDPPPEEWADIYRECETFLGETISDEAVNSAYLEPAPRWKLRQRPIPLIVDAAARATGKRLVRRLDGTVLTQGWSAAAASTTTQLTTHAARRMAGGVFDSDDLRRTVPYQVRSVFKRPDDTRYTVDKSLTSLAMGEYGAFAGMANMTATYYADPVFVDEDSDADALAAEAARDWYGFQLAPTDQVYAGVVAWTPTAYQDVIEWEYNLDTVRTRVLREPFFQPPSAGPECPPETQIVEINPNVRNAEGLYQGRILMYDRDEKVFKLGSELIWVKDANG